MAALPLAPRATLAIASLLILGTFSCVDTLAANPQGGTVVSGRVLFETEWSVLDAASSGDGLGPLFNATSCKACHHLGGVGGSGTNEENVHLLAVHWDRISEQSDRENAASVARDIHSDLNKLSAIPLHRFAIDPSYESWRFKALGFRVEGEQLTFEQKSKFYGSLASRMRSHDGPMFFKNQKVPFVMTERNTPALFGIGLIDEIDDEAIRKLAQEQRGKSLGISGRVAVANDRARDPLEVREAGQPLDGDIPPRIGRFGWKAHTSTLGEFVLGACANELGLQTINHPQPEMPSGVVQGKLPRQDDLSVNQCRALISFVAELPRSRQVVSQGLVAPQVDLMGKTIFSNLGCAHCHVSQLDNVDGIYSDLLLHDMGGELADPIPANPPFDPKRQGKSRVQREGWGVAELPPIALFSTEEIKEMSREWRTPPLWGVADSAPYLHDGRAKSLIEAIELHGGEALVVRQRYEALPASGKSALISFLNTLVGPSR